MKPYRRNILRLTLSLRWVLEFHKQSFRRDRFQARLYNNQIFMLIFDSFLDQLWQIGKQRDVPNITPSNARFLSEFVQKHSLRNLLEIGTAN